MRQGEWGGENTFFTIIHIIGLPGAGKTNLAKKLSKKYNLPIFRIGEYRSKFPLSPIGETDAWVALFQGLSRRKWRKCILETTEYPDKYEFVKKLYKKFKRYPAEIRIDTTKFGINKVCHPDRQRVGYSNDTLF
jgi:deoxyadenosine/deoxycytidine kinase